MKILFAAIILNIIAFSAAVFAQETAEPEIMSYEEYGTIRHERPYILRFTHEKGALVYFGFGHTFDPKDPQIARLEKEFLEFKPTLLLNESGTPPALETAEQAIARYGEPGFLSFLAKKHSVPIKSLDPPRLDEMKYIIGTKRWSLEQVFLFYVLRRIPENNKKASPQNPDAIVQEALTISAKTPGFEGLPKTIAEFDALAAKHFPKVENWRSIEPKIFDPNPALGHFTNDIADASVQYRGRFMVKNLLEQVGKGERIFAVVGASHVVKQEKALKKAFAK